MTNHIAMSLIYEKDYKEIQKKEEQSKMRAKYKNVAAMKNYVELNRPAKPDGWVLIERIEIDLRGKWTCPAHCLAIYAHNEDLDYEQIFDDQENNVFNVLDDCTSLEELQKRAKLNLLPDYITEHSIS